MQSSVTTVPCLLEHSPPPPSCVVDTKGSWLVASAQCVGPFSETCCVTGWALPERDEKLWAKAGRTWGVLVSPNLPPARSQSSPTGALAFSWGNLHCLQVKAERLCRAPEHPLHPTKQRTVPWLPQRQHCHFFPGVILPVCKSFLKKVQFVRSVQKWVSKESGVVRGVCLVTWFCEHAQRRGLWDFCGHPVLCLTHSFYCPLRCTDRPSLYW